LRIGTAEQTVLVSLAQAFAQTPSKGVESEPEETAASSDVEDDDSDKESTEDTTDLATRDPTSLPGSCVEPDSVSLNQLINDIQEREPTEAKSLRENPKLSKEKRYELAVIVVKRAFSECPSLDILVRALLTSPLYDIHKVCRLIPGVPVAPMLAKPTKVRIALAFLARRLLLDET
jgi:ATP-dependent DNA ligase